MLVLSTLGPMHPLCELFEPFGAPPSRSRCQRRSPTRASSPRQHTTPLSRRTALLGQRSRKDVPLETQRSHVILHQPSPTRLQLDIVHLSPGTEVIVRFGPGISLYDFCSANPGRLGVEALQQHPGGPVHWQAASSRHSHASSWRPEVQDTAIKRKRSWNIQPRRRELGSWILEDTKMRMTS